MFRLIAIVLIVPLVGGMVGAILDGMVGYTPLPTFGQHVHDIFNVVYGAVGGSIFVLEWDKYKSTKKSSTDSQQTTVT